MCNEAAGEARRDRMLRVVCKLPAPDAHRIGYCDIVDVETGEVKKTAEALFNEAVERVREELRPCGMVNGWAVKATCRKCPNMKRMWEEE